MLFNHKITRPVLLKRDVFKEKLSRPIKSKLKPYGFLKCKTFKNLPYSSITE